MAKVIALTLVLGLAYIKLRPYIRANTERLQRRKDKTDDRRKKPHR